MTDCDENICNVKSTGEIQAEEKLKKWLHEIGLDEDKDDDSKRIDN